VGNVYGKKEKVGEVIIDVDRCFMSKLEVDSKCQKCGIGSNLFNHAMEQLAKNGCSETRWLSYSEAVPFYEIQGARKSLRDPINSGERQLQEMYYSIDPKD
jgi:GNAT superfamily N-acetyltransferase